MTICYLCSQPTKKKFKYHRLCVQKVKDQLKYMRMEMVGAWRSEGMAWRKIRELSVWKKDYLK